MTLRVGGHSLLSIRRDRWELAASALGLATNSMSAESQAEFVDANVLVYACDASADHKFRVAGQLLERLWESGTGCISIQVVQEFFVSVTRKVPRPLSVEEATERIREFARWKVFAPVIGDVLEAIALQKQAKLSFWDAMIVQAAVESGCHILWTEDLSDGQMLRGVRIRNPFALPLPPDPAPMAKP
jgi:predicted nucleic acid-binding protein